MSEPETYENDVDTGVITLKEALAGPYSETAIAELSAADRRKLPATWHRPYWMGLTTWPAWICTACWSDGVHDGWPCYVATKGGKELAPVLGLGYAW